MRKVGTFEGKTYFSALVDAAERGETIIVTRKGRPVAQIGPLSAQAGAVTREEAIKRILARKVYAGVPPSELIDERRKY